MATLIRPFSRRAVWTCDLGHSLTGFDSIDSYLAHINAHIIKTCNDIDKTLTDKEAE